MGINTILLYLGENTVLSSHLPGSSKEWMAPVYVNAPFFDASQDPSHLGRHLVFLIASSLFSHQMAATALAIT